MTKLRTAAFAAVLTGLAAGCTVSAGGSITPVPSGSPSASATMTPTASPTTAPTASPSTTPVADCTTTTERDAQTFALQAPATATANTPFEATVWTYQNKTPSVAVETIVPNSFKATVDATAKTITFGGRVSAVIPNPNASEDCAFIMIAGGEPNSVKVNVTAPAGTYRLILQNYSDQFAVPPASPAPPAAQPGSITIN